eukprot:scaffold12742_cov18-Tisochrysis_lutea.AAC.2
MRLETEADTVGEPEVARKERCPASWQGSAVRAHAAAAAAAACAQHAHATSQPRTPPRLAGPEIQPARRAALIKEVATGSGSGDDKSRHSQNGGSKLVRKM